MTAILARVSALAWIANSLGCPFPIERAQRHFVNLAPAL